MIVNNANGLTDIYQTRYAFGNLYKIEIYNQGSDIEDASIDTDTFKLYANFNATSVQFPEETFNTTRNSVTKKFQIDGDEPYKWADTLTITYRESEQWQVKRYHEEWLSLFYNKETDKYRSHNDSINEGLFRNISVFLPDDKKITFYNVIPSNVGSFNFSWGESANIITHTITYHPEYWQWETWDSSSGGGNN